MTDAERLKARAETFDELAQEMDRRRWSRMSDELRSMAADERFKIRQLQRQRAIIDHAQKVASQI